MAEQIVWDLVNPEGMAQSPPFTVKSHTGSLENKTVLLRWNGKHNGDVFLNIIAGLLKAKVKGVNIVKAWEIDPDTSKMSGNVIISRERAGKLAAFKPDMVIASQGD